MASKHKSLESRINSAVKHFWRTRASQGQTQGRRSGQRDYGNRAVTTGGKQLDAFNALICDLLVESGIPRGDIYAGGRQNVTLPGFFRPTKQWDVVVVSSSHLIAAIECKALCGPSFGNNYNNRVEEALGSANDLWTAYREGIFKLSPRPFLGYFLLLEAAEASTRPVAVSERHFPVFKEFRDASYMQRCEECLRRLLRERCYDAAAFLVSEKASGVRGKYVEPATELSFHRFANLLIGQTIASYRSVQGK